MTRSIIAFITALLLMMLLLSCTKHKDDFVSDIPQSHIVFSSPTEGGVFFAGDSVRIQARATSTHTIHGYDVAVRKVNDTTLLYFKNVHDHNDTLLVNQSWKNIVDISAQLEASVTLYLDHDGNTNTRKVTFSTRIR